MGCKTSDFFNRNATSSSSVAAAAAREVLLFTTLCIVGVPVEVQLKNGSIYSGIFHTALVDNGDYDIILRKAKVNTKGKVNGAEEVVDTLVVSSCDIVQVVVKGILHPSEGIVRDVPSEDVEALIESAQSLAKLNNELKISSSSKTAPELHAKENITQSGYRRLGQNENKAVSSLIDNTATSPNVEKSVGNGGFLVKVSGSTVQTVNVKTDEAPPVLIGPVVEGQVGKYQSQVNMHGSYQKIVSPQKNDIHEVQLSTSCANSSLLQPLYPSSVHGSNKSSNEPPPSLLEHYSQDFERPTSVGSSLEDCCPSKECVNMSSQLSTSEPASQTPSVATIDSIPCVSSKEFKLNPGAKTFMPMFSVPKSTALMLPSTVSTMDSIPKDPYVVAAAVTPPEDGTNSFAARTFTKFTPCNNLVALNGDNASQHSQPIIGHVGGRMHSVRYNSRCAPLQAGPAYVHPSSPAVMVGRLGQLVYMHPISHDLIQGSTVPAPIPMRPQLTSQVFLPKHQGNATAQGLQVCVAQSPFVVGGQQPYALASNFPPSLPTFPGHFNPKFL